jgi:hypothetical protein
MKVIWSALLIFFLWTGLQGQSLVVLEETTDFEGFRFRDVSTEVRLRVQLNSAETLTNILPSLEAPACAMLNGEPLFNTTYLGYRSGSSTIASSLPTLAQNETAVFVFNIHFSSPSSNACQAQPCGDTIEFDLSFTHGDNVSPIQASVGQTTTFTAPPERVYDVLERVGTTGRGVGSCLEISNTLSVAAAYEGFDPTLLSDPTTRVLLGIDYDSFTADLTSGFESALRTFTVPVGGNFLYLLYEDVVINGLVNISEPVTESGTGRDFNVVSLLGGGGGIEGDNSSDCSLEFWNFFDITDRSAQGPSVRNVLGDWGSFQVEIDVRDTQMDHRETALFLATEQVCLARDGLGSNISDFEISEVAFKGDALVDVVVNVPSSWLGSGNNLRSGYQLSWFYRNSNTFAPAAIVTGTSQSTVVTLSVPYTTPNDFQIEARITRTNAETGTAIASVVSPFHQLIYRDTGADQFRNAEVNPNPDQYLDPGETLEKNLQITNAGSNALSGVTISLDVASPGTDVLFDTATSTGPFDGIVQIDETVQIDLLYELLRTDAVCAPITLNYIVNYTSNGFSSSYNLPFTISANCELITRDLALDESWTALASSGTPPCIDANCSGSTVSQVSTDEWFFESETGHWVGTSIDNTSFYELISPVFPAGDNATLTLLHEAGFVTGEAGGVIEYRDCANGVDCDDQPWQDLILAIETANNVVLYDDAIFPELDSSLNRVVSDRHVFQGMIASRLINETVPNDLFTRPYVQFRFVYQVTENGGFPPPGTCTLESFNYTYQERVADNALQLPETVLGPCPDAILTLTPGVTGIYLFQFYNDVNDLLAGNPAQETNVTGIWAYPIPSTNTNYFAVVENTNTDVRRIWPIPAFSEQPVPEFATCVASWFSDPYDAGCDLNVDQLNDIRDLVIQRNEDLCVE